MQPLYGQDLAYIQAVAFGDLARGAAAEIVRRLRSASIPIRRVVDVGCGAGPLTAALLEAGFELTGIDISAELLRIARVSVPEASFLHGSIYEVEIPTCEAVMAIGEPLTYHNDDDGDRRLEKFFHRVAKILPINGMLIFDVIELGEPSLTSRSCHAGEDWAVLVDTKEDRASRKLTREIEIFRREGELYRRGHERHNVQLFDSQVLRRQLTEAGFVTSTAQGYGDYPLAPRRRAFFATRTADQTRQ